MEKFTRLQEITGQDFGVVIFEGNDLIIGNWAPCMGVPRVDQFGYGLVGMGEELEIVGVKHMDDVSVVTQDATIQWDINNDINKLKGRPGIVYQIVASSNEAITVIAPQGWD